MIYQTLGDTEISVSKMCFGSLTMTPFQSNLSVETGSSLICYAYDHGVNFIDTAELYDNYAYIRRALEYIPRSRFVIATKTYAHTRELAIQSLNRALHELQTDYIDIFLLHEQESEWTIRGHWEAVEALLEAKKNGKIRAIGISTHKIAGVRGFLQFPELDVIHPILNVDGFGILDGTRDEMVKELSIAKQRGKGIYTMKPLAGGHLIGSLKRSFDYLNQQPFIDSIAVGVQSKDEIDCDLQLMGQMEMNESLVDRLQNKKRELKVADYCTGCGKCTMRCQHQAITLINDRAMPNDRCVLCGYCAKECPDFCIKVV